MLTISKVLISRQENPAFLSEAAPYLSYHTETDLTPTPKTFWFLPFRECWMGLPQHFLPTKVLMI